MKVIILKGFREKVLMILNKALFNPVIVDILPEEVKAFPFAIWDANLNVASVRYNVEYKNQRAEAIKLKNGQSVFNSSAKQLEALREKKNQLVEIYDDISHVRYQSTVELERVISSPALLRSYSEVPGFKELLSKLYETTIEREPLNNLDIRIIEILLVSSVLKPSVWELLPDDVKTIVIEKILIKFVNNDKTYGMIVRDILTKNGRSSTSYIFGNATEFVAKVYSNLRQKNSEFRDRTSKLQQRNGNTEFMRTFNDLDIFAFLEEIVREPAIPDEVKPEEGYEDEAAQIESYFRRIDLTGNPRELIEVLKELYLLLHKNEKERDTVGIILSSLKQNQIVLLNNVLNRLLVNIYLNQRNFVLCSLSEDIFDEIVELVPVSTLPKDDQITPFDFVNKGKELISKIEFDIKWCIEGKSR